MSQRVFAMTIAIVFGISAVAVSAFAIYDMTQSRKNQPSQDVQEQLAKAQQQEAANKEAQAKCPPSGSSPALPAPEVYKPSGKVERLEATDLEAGDGEEAKAGSCVVVKYYGTLASDGTMFDENFTQDSSFAVTLGAGQVIPGWDEGLVGLKVGGTRRLVIPADKAYGSQSAGKIPANSDLVFVVKLLEIKK